MIELTVIDRAGAERTLNAAEGLNLMEVLRDAGCDELAAMCGGNGACATCHVYVESAAGALAAKSKIEEELLETSLHVREDSRLSCQLPVNEALNRARITIAPED